MGWSYRKSFGSGPFRVNFSKSGISYSMGVKGARVNVGPKGTFVNLSSHGLSYRKKIGTSAKPAPTILPKPLPSFPGNTNNIASGSISSLSDIDSQSFIAEMSEKANQISYLTWFGFIPMVLLILVALFNAASGAVFLVLFLVFVPLLIWLKKVDQRRFELALHYDMDSQFQQLYQQFCSNFRSFSQTARIWHYLNAQQVNDAKRNGGANKLINRAAIAAISVNQMPLRNFVTNIQIPYLKLSNLELYFLPERLLLKRGETFAAVFYKHLQISSTTIRFVESESLPRDAQVVDHTWKYLNKSGGPDRRFSNNAQLPICNYSEYTLKSTTGIYEVISTSKPGAMDAFAGFLTKIGSLQP